MNVAEERLKSIENEITGLRASIEKILSSAIPSPNKKPMDRMKLLDLFGKWDGDIDDFLHDFYERRERRGRLE